MFDESLHPAACRLLACLEHVRLRLQPPRRQGRQGQRSNTLGDLEGANSTLRLDLPSFHPCSCKRRKNPERLARGIEDFARFVDGRVGESNNLDARLLAKRKKLALNLPSNRIGITVEKERLCSDFVGELGEFLDRPSSANS